MRPSGVRERKHEELKKAINAGNNALCLQLFRKEFDKRNGLFSNTNETCTILRFLANGAIARHYDAECLNLLEFFLNISVEAQHQMYDQQENERFAENATNKLRSCLCRYPQLAEKLSNDLYPCAQGLLVKEQINGIMQQDRPVKRRKMLADSGQQVQPMRASQIASSQVFKDNGNTTISEILASTQSSDTSQRVLNEQKNKPLATVIKRTSPVNRVLFPSLEPDEQNPQGSSFELATCSYVLHDRPEPSSPTRPSRVDSTETIVVEALAPEVDTKNAVYQATVAREMRTPDQQRVQSENRNQREEKVPLISHKKKWLGLAALLGSAGGAYLLHVNKENKKNEKVKKEERVDSEEAINTELLNHSI